MFLKQKVSINFILNLNNDDTHGERENLILRYFCTFKRWNLVRRQQLIYSMKPRLIFTSYRTIVNNYIIVTFKYVVFSVTIRIGGHDYVSHFTCWWERASEDQRVFLLTQQLVELIFVFLFHCVVSPKILNQN